MGLAAGCATEVAEEDAEESEGANTVGLTREEFHRVVSERLTDAPLLITLTITFEQVPSASRPGTEWHASAGANFGRDRALLLSRKDPRSGMRCDLWAEASADVVSLSLPWRNEYRVARVPLDGVEANERFKIELLNGDDNPGAEAGSPANLEVRCQLTKDPLPNSEVNLDFLRRVDYDPPWEP
jgi:hypothetical protein